MNFFRNCGRCWRNYDENKSEIATEIENPVYDSEAMGKQKVIEQISNPSTKTSANPTGTMEIINSCYVKAATDIKK